MKVSTITKITALYCIMAGFVVPVKAESVSEKADPFLGISLGKTKAQAGLKTQADTYSFDANSTGYQLYGGVKLDNNIVIGGAYTDFGKDSSTVQVQEMPVAVTLEAQSFGAYAGYEIYPGEGDFFIMPRLGFHMWNGDAEATARGKKVPLNYPDNGTDLFYGISSGYKISESVDLTVGYDIYKMDSGKIKFLQLGVRFWAE